MSPYSLYGRRSSPDCVLHKLSAELRRMIFDSVLDDFFAEFPDRRDMTCIGGDYWGPPQRPRFARLGSASLPSLELALVSSDTWLHSEFITARIEASCLLLQPGEFIIKNELPHLALPCLSHDDISRRLLRTIRVIVVMVGVPDDPKGNFAGLDDEERMQIVSKALSDFPKATCTPSLRKIVVRFPSSARTSSRLSGCDSFLEYERFRKYLWRGLKKYVGRNQLKAFEFDDIRDWNVTDYVGPDEFWNEHYHGERSPGHMQLNPRFRSFTINLNRIFGFQCKARSEVAHEHKNGELWNTYKATETWRAPSGLVWNDNAQAELDAEKRRILRYSGRTSASI